MATMLKYVPMFDTPEKRFRFAATKVRELFPGITDEQIALVAQSFSTQFYPGYSPRPEEWNPGQTGIGSGADAESFLAVEGSCLLEIEEEKINIDPKIFLEASRKIFTT